MVATPYNDPFGNNESARKKWHSMTTSQLSDYVYALTQMQRLNDAKLDLLKDMLHGLAADLAKLQKQNRRDKPNLGPSEN